MDSKCQPKVVPPIYHVDFHSVASDADDILDDDDNGRTPHNILETEHQHQHQHHHHQHHPHSTSHSHRSSGVSTPTTGTSTSSKPHHQQYHHGSDPASHVGSNFLLTRNLSSSSSSPSTPPTPVPLKREPQPLAKRLVLSMKNASLATEWKPSPHLKVRV
jgi:hypothetical protein